MAVARGVFRFPGHLRFETAGGLLEGGRKNRKGGHRREEAPSRRLAFRSCMGKELERKRMGKKDGRGGVQQHQPPPPGLVTEFSRVRISKTLEEFRGSQAEVYTFEPGLSKEERAVIHIMCRKMGMLSKSSGRGERRCLSVYKNKKENASIKKEEFTTYLQFSEDTKNILQDLFMHYPPEDMDLSEDAVRNTREKIGNRQWKQDATFSKPSISKSDIAKKVEELSSRISNSAELGKVIEDRAKLPIASFEHAITSTLENNQVVLISGETGCGKTTQVPQYLLEHMWDKGEVCKIICTQPRRISAISVAERISYERGEPVGETVGYKIRLESKGGKHSSIIFCTNGVFLRLLISRGSSFSSIDAGNSSLEDCLQGITHVIVDEIHERDRYSDFMLTILRDLLPAYPHIRLALMSATLDAERFSNYFNGCPIIQVPGFTYPVKTFYLEDVLSILKPVDDNHLNHVAVNDSEESNPLSAEDKSVLDEAICLALTNEEFDPLLELISTEQTPRIYNYRHSSTGVSPLMVFARKGRVGDVCMLLSYGADCALCDNSGKRALDWAECENQGQTYEIIKKHMEKDKSKSVEDEELINEYLASVNQEHIDTVLIERLLEKICTDPIEGAILIFLPGWDDINQTRERLVASPFFQDQSKFWIISLHSMIPSAEQKKVFKRPPVGARKIILSTNIAETAVTIDDVVYVIDSGRMKEKSYDPYSNVSTLHSSWVSKASARQREGRAGRCRPGTCYHLFSKFRAASLPDYQVPEIKRMPIEELCLQVKLLDPSCRLADFLQKTLDPPVSETVRNAIIVLQDIGALTDDERLTDLGKQLGSLPVHPTTSKMLLFAILMNCLDPALTLACAADYREPFLLPMAPDGRKKATLAKLELASLCGGCSDQLAVVAAFDCWKKAKERGQESQFCSRYFVSSGTMNMLCNMRKQLQSELAKHGFIPKDASNCSLNAHDPGILRAVLMAGAYPMVGRFLPRRKNDNRTVVETASGAKVRLHPHSSNFNLSFSKEAICSLVIYDEITRGDGGMYIKNCSLVDPYPLLLLAKELAVAPSDDLDANDEDLDDSSNERDELGPNKSSSTRGEEIMSSPDNNVSVFVDGWLRFESTALDVAQIYCLREHLSSTILFKVKNPRAVLPPALGASMYAIACILSYDGLPRALSEAAFDGRSSVGDAGNTNKPIQGRRRAGFIPPGAFLRSLFSAEVETPHVQKYRKTQQSQSAPRAPNTPFHGPKFGSSAPRRRSFKRRR
ncbi:DExH-box ATP-dependent RNA helicase DExH6-like [Zingiber officinale]|uniref:DExH-box ATP-dependent RNA helicase DExH6-like n=1 Tax=Zingiber officinale TaxID=94328 RepID=UPI001C4D7649|nr:DExH-box ATP-dependent RNA helicase DExH6-like [Zingiber officinale]